MKREEYTKGQILEYSNKIAYNSMLYVPIRKCTIVYGTFQCITLHCECIYLECSDQVRSHKFVSIGINIHSMNELMGH